MTAYITPVSFRGLLGYCTGYAADSDGAVYASFIGRVTALNGIWAAFQSREILRAADLVLKKRPELEGAKYHTLKTRLPDSGWAHLVLVHTQATVHNLPDEVFYVLSESEVPVPGGEEPPLDRFWHMWNRALPLPAHADWVQDLWTHGLAAGAIQPIAAAGIHCWRVSASPKWGVSAAHLRCEIVARIATERR